MPDYAFIAYDTTIHGQPTTLQLNLRNLTDTTYSTSSPGTHLGVQIGEPFQAIASARVFW